MKSFFKPHRVVLIVLALALVAWCALSLNWTWLANPKYQLLIVQGIWRTIWLVVVTMVIGMILAVPIGLAQAAGPWYVSAPARVFCTVIRGTPLLMQIWLLYYGLGSLFPSIPWIKQSDLWPYLRQAWPYAVVALSLSVAGYEGEVMRGAFKGVPHGQLEAAKAMGMSPFTLLRRIWLPPLVSTITIVEIYSVTSRVRQDTFIIYEPLLLLAVVYMCLTGLIVLLFRWFEGRTPTRTA